MRILGIDPGYAIMGWGVIDNIGNRFEVVDYGAVTTSKDMDMPLRLKQLYNSLMDIIARTEPETAAIEQLFYNTNQKTVIMVGQARGVAMLACANSGLEINEYTPLQIKQALVGYGRAEKKQVQTMVKTILGLDEIPKPDDTADAIAAAITHAHAARGRSIMRNAKIAAALEAEEDRVKKSRAAKAAGGGAAGKRTGAKGSPDSGELEKYGLPPGIRIRKGI